MVTKEVERNRANWKKWVVGPYKFLLESDTYKKGAEEWESGCTRC